ncbi:uncharacterized protein [Henckelia pumila]|uniref:uncharacterized protein n=1 Tax=Henckelia pumila TaxID=405737 RepID=UPI003C6E2EEB
MSSQIVDNGSDDFWMVVRKRPVRFSMLDYCLITCLDCSVEPTDLPDGGGIFVSRHFVGKSQIFLSDLKAKIVALGQNETEGMDVEKLKMASLYFYCVVFCWGSRKKSVKGQGSKEVHGNFFLSGFVLPLQILAYEYYPSVAQNFAKRRDVEDGLIFPRMFKWVTNTWPSNRAPYDVDVSAAFGACDINDCVGCLTPTSEELVSSYYTTGVFVDSAPDVVTTRVLELWSQGKTVIRSQRPLENDVESPLVQHTPSYHDGSSTPSTKATGSSSSTPSADATRSSSSTRPPIPTGLIVHFGCNTTRRTSPLEHRFGRRLSALDDTINSLRLEMRAQFIESRACIRAMKAGFDELRSILTEQIRAGLAEIRSQTAMHI